MSRYRHHWDRAKCQHYRGVCITVKPPWYRYQRYRTKCPHYRGVCFAVRPPDTDTSVIEPSVCITEVSVLQANLLVQTPPRQRQVSALQRCLYYSQMSRYRHHWDRAKCQHYRGVCITVKPPWYRYQRYRTKCPHYRGVCFAVRPPDTDTSVIEPSVCITEVSVLQSYLLNTDTKGHNQVFTSQRCGGRDCVKLGIIGTKESFCNK